MRKPQVVPAGPRAGVLGSESPCFKFGPVDKIVLEDSSLVIPRGREDTDLREWLTDHLDKRLMMASWVSVCPYPPPLSSTLLLLIRLPAETDLFLLKPLSQSPAP